MLITLAVAITLSQQNIRIIIIITLFHYVITADAEGNLNILCPKRRNWFCDEITHILLCKENTGDDKKRAGGWEGKEEEEGGTKLECG